MHNPDAKDYILGYDMYSPGYTYGTVLDTEISELSRKHVRLDTRAQLFKVSLA